jgi:site-specific DNA recombinase
MCAARRKGKWLGGPPILGYDLDREKHRLVINPEEAEMVREMFDLYVQRQSTIKVVEELNRRGWTTKSWVKKDGTRHEGARWDKARLIRHLSNMTYTGKILHKGEVFPGEHEAIIDTAIFDQAQSLIANNGNGSGPAARNQHGALLKGLLRCGRCGAAMAHTYTKKKGRLYRYYACNTRQKQGRSACDTPSLPAQDVEDFVVQQIRRIGQDPDLVEQVYAEALRQQKADIPKLEAEHTQLLRQRRRKGEEIKRLIAVLADADQPLVSVTEHLRETEVAVARLDTRLAELKDQIALIRSQTIDSDHLRETLAQFVPLWEVLHPEERIAFVRQVIKTVRYDSASESIAITV